MSYRTKEENEDFNKLIKTSRKERINAGIVVLVIMGILFLIAHFA